MTAIALYVDRKPIRLGRRIGRGGEGEVFVRDDDPTFAVKIYNPNLRAQREPKVMAMVAGDLGRHSPLVAFPVSIARSADGKFVGFVMRLLQNHRPVHDLYSPGSRKLHFPKADYRFLTRTALNIARASAAVHQAGCVVGDINHSGILVSSKAIAALIDADSFQFVAGPQTYRCIVGVPEYTPPELQGQSLANIVRTPNHDAFGLAVIIFQLLFMGRHPFVGAVRKGEVPPIQEAIRDYRYVYDDGRDVGMDQPPGTPALDRFYRPIAETFDAAFGRDTRDRRPSALRWIDVLSGLESSLIACDDNALHYIPRDADECAWCEMDQQLGTVLFPPYVPNPTLVPPTCDPGSGFDLHAVWSRIDAIVIPVVPRAAPPAFGPPSAEATRGDWQHKTARLIAVLGGTALTVLMPSVWILWLILGWLLWTSTSTNRAKYESRYLEAERAYVRAHAEFERRSGVADCVALKGELAAARDEYLGLAAAQKRQIESYKKQRRERQLHSFLDTFNLRHATVKGLGPAKLAILASFGIDTAADVTRGKVLSVPGFGPTNSQPLLAWRAKLEKRFVYREQQTDDDLREYARIHAATQSRAIALRKTLAAGQQNLERVASRAQQVLNTPDSALEQARRNRDQAASDLRYLRLRVPGVPKSAPLSGPAPPTGGSRAVRSCPRCGATMVRRTARRGPNAGGQFWGCTRYPRCRGTRSI